jgi:UMF1 family MFS transporter
VPFLCTFIQVVISGIFLGTALLHLADIAAGCDVTKDENGDVPDCNGKVLGMKPSSLLAVMGVITGLLAALTMPIIGAVVDHTNLRWTVGVVSAGFLVGINAIQIFLAEPNWLFMAILQVTAAYIYLVHCVVQYAYLPELTKDDAELTSITASSNMWQFFTQVIYLMVVIGASMALGFTAEGYVNGDVHTAVLSQSLVSLYAGFMFIYSWKYCMKKRPALHKLPQGESLVSIGPKQIAKTVADMSKNHRPVYMALLAIMFTEAGANAFTTIAVTYAKEVLGMAGSETGQMILVCLVFAVPGSKLFAKVTNKVGAHKSYMMSLAYWAMVTMIAPFCMNSPETKNMSYVFGIFWGLGFGWIYPTQRNLFCNIMPAGQESELMGIYIFAGQIIVWLPPLIFTAFNEAGLSMKWGLMSDALFFLIALAIAANLGDFELACIKAKGTASKRIMADDVNEDGEASKQGGASELEINDTINSV